VDVACGNTLKETITVTVFKFLVDLFTAICLSVEHCRRSFESPHVVGSSIGRRGGCIAGEHVLFHGNVASRRHRFVLIVVSDEERMEAIIALYGDLRIF
jgi:hypothetical protein